MWGLRVFGGPWVWGSEGWGLGFTISDLGFGAARSITTNSNASVGSRPVNLQSPNYTERRMERSLNPRGIKLSDGVGLEGFKGRGFRVWDVGFRIWGLHPELE